MEARPGVFLLLLVTVLQAVASKKEIICENSKTTLSCPSNKVIKIQQATYGRSDKRTCKHQHIKTTRCSTKKPLGITRKNCNGRKSCAVAANNWLYGDPCPGTYKYVTVSYSCKGTTPKCRKRCHKRAKCINGKCVCKPRYQGDGVRSCKNKRASGYIGCYKDDRTRILSKKVLKDKGMTVQKCQQFCGKKGFKFAGVEYGYECFCGNVLRKGRKRKESDCKTPCSGNKQQICGGTWRISIYTGKTPKCTKKCHKNAKCIKGRCVCKSRYQASGYIGCYKDDKTRILSKKVLKDKGMTVQKCQQFCGKKGFKFAGVEYGYECFCGNVLRKDRKRKESDCKTPCSGNKQQICGGTWRISIYTGKTPKCTKKCHKNAKCIKGRCVCKSRYQGDGVRSCKKGKPSGYIGCYKDDRTRILSKKVLKDKGMTVQKCQQFCGKKGFKFAGVEYGYECFCGNVLRKGRKRKESDCKTPCSGNKQQICGGTWRISIYTGTTPKCRKRCHKRAKCINGKCVCKPRYQGDGVRSCKNKRASGYIGCYKDDRTRILSKKVLKDKGMTVQKCQQFCGKKGFKFAGVEYGYECFCGNVLRKGRKRKESDCKTPCSGNKQQICGGTWRISIYTGKTPKCTKKCHKNAKCIKGRCVCKSRYQGDGVRSCKKGKRSGYIGCYKDDKTRILSKKVLKDKGMTVQKCQQFCGKKGFKFAGVEYGYECFCGNVLRKGRKRKESDCKTPCSGNKQQICGGTWRISIYTSKTPKCTKKCHKNAKCIKGRCVCKSRYQGDGVRSCKKGKPSGYIGCYKDDRTRILSKKVLKDKGMTVQKCQQFCGKKGFKFAGVEYGYECFCGNVLRKGRKRKESDCKTPCSGNKQQTCGGTWRISVYTAKTSKCMKKCHKKAKCIKGKCVCKAKYQGDGIKSCKKTKRKPSNCKEKCHKNGKCRRGRCRCKKGYTGDGINVCSKSCTCSATGDPHYRSFDGQILHFMGTCKYTLSQYDNPKSACRFHVQVKNENRGNKRVSYTRSVHVVVRKTKIDLLKNRAVKVDGIKRYLPYKTGYFSIINSGRYVRLKTTCNVIITWDGRSAVTISVPSHFSQNLIGLCGNCNGIKDDLKTKDGLDVRTKPDKFTLIGESYLIREGNGKKCGVSTPPDPCTSTLRNKAIRNTACGQLNPVNPSSPFRDCSIEDMALAQDIYDTCVYDYCAYSDQPDIINTIVCEAAEGLEERCENMGFDISWRKKQFCPFICEHNMEYSSAVSGCPATCVDLDAPKTCKLPPSEGCQCEKGFVLSDNKCIPRAQCGCRLPTGEYYPIGTEITSRDCRTVSKCVAKKSGYAKMQVIRRQKCHRNAQCKLLNGIYDCACEEGFKGDGIKQCKGKPEPGTEKVICEGLKSRITCRGKKTIRILEATYGRTDMGTCKDPRVKTTSCSSNKPLPILRKNCDGIKSCMVSANNGLYGDPCGGTYKYVTVRYVCEETGPKCGSTVCHPEAKCHRGRCVCKKGFVGDGVNSCIGTCTCVASGDPHYKSFDGQVIHFMGICTYTMVKSTSIDKCGGFEVQVQNEHRGSNTKVSYTQYVLVKLADATIRLDKNNVVFVNDVQVYTPYSRTNFEITTSGRYVRLQTKCNILITWNGVGTVAVSVPKTYSGIVTGLCGDCNGKKDDFRTATGEDVSLKKDKFELIGKSYTVPGIYETQDKKCVVGPVIEEPCSAEQSSEAADDKYCGLLNPKNGYEEQCEDMGLSITWRRKYFCPLTCPENMDYTTSGSGCPATCVDPDAPITCRLPNTEGCQCKEGFLLSGNECVPKEQCGCRGPEGEYYPLGKQFTSSDCTIVTKCSSENGKPTMTVVKQQICHQNAKCRLRRGQYRCICKKKFKGNGVDVCTPKCKRKCKINERCVKGKCRCEKRFSQDKTGSMQNKDTFFLGKCRPKECKRKCRINEWCVKGKCRCKKGSFRTKLRTCKRKIPCTPKCDSGFVCSFLGKCRPKGKILCTQKCESGFVCSFLGKCRPKECKRKCRINEWCVKGKCQCKKGTFRTKLGTCKRKIPCTPKCESGFVCSFLGKCRPKECKRKCRINERCVKGKCRCKKDTFRTKQGTCKKRCNVNSCGVNAVCVKRKYCRCKTGYAGHPETLCEEVKECIKNARGSDYIGKMSTTESGRTCQAWNKQTPHRHSKSNVGDAKNYCRNPDNEPRPWCYTTDSKKRWEFCRIPICGAPKPPCGDMVIMPCHSDRKHRTDCRVPNAERINYIELKSGEDNPSCTFGVTYGFYGVTIWSKESCREKIKVCLTPKNRVPILPPPEECKRKCRINERCVKGKCRCKKDTFRTKQGTCKKRCNVNSCGVNAVCVKRKYCRCKTGYAGHPKTLCEEVKECIKNARGSDYIGKMSTTESGRTCQAWNKQTPHRHSKSNVGDAKNYCRNPDNEPRPWCYTTDSKKRWEFCRIPICGK
ncbi:unnamed protein product [Mytilus coruscus]|uniref:Uncharacterized protein n=1 Tax=Mytilus coruscus TaxID=42192 RepID=A0A6J8EV80_MYTCO|nr:unnamed protein product [Mytilus coruscus]